MEDQNGTPNEELDQNIEQVNAEANPVEGGVKEELSSGSDELITQDPVAEEVVNAELENTEAENTAGEDASTEDISLSEVLEAQDKEADTAKEEVKPKEPKSNKRWYSLRVISGKEKKIKERIELEIQRNKWSESITQVLVPSEKVYKIRNGKKVILERNILPGYILVEALKGGLKGAMITAIANIPNVIHFLGRNHPIPMHQSEANRMLGKVDESQDVSAAMIEPFIVGETIKIIDGPFNDFVGDIKEVNEEKKKLKVIVKIFGRGTEVELNFMQVEKQS